MTDSAARLHAIECPGSVLVQAPAGSGKTTLLTQRYLRLLARVDAPERILALTFTRRAAEEMRERVLAALRAARLDRRPAGMQPATWDLAAAASRHLRILEIDVLGQPARLRIETIDAFNAWLASQLPISAGAGSAPQLLADARPSYEEAARRALAHEEEDRFGLAVERVLALDDQRWRRLVDLIADMLQGRDRWLPLLAGRLQAARTLDDQQLDRVRRQLDEDLRLLISRVLARARDALGPERIATLSRLAQRAASRAGDNRPDPAHWNDDGTSLRADAADLPRWRAAAAWLLRADGELRSQVTKNEGFPPRCEDKPPMLDLLQEFAREPAARAALRELRGLPSPAYSDEQWGRVQAVTQLLVFAAAQLDQVFREQGAVDFPAVSLAALRALGATDAPSDLGLRLDYRLQHILVDEFQDTSGAQLELLRSLTAGWQPGDGRSVFCVGDPMQSIYGFRQAEVRAFLELAEDGIGDLRFDLERLRDNFRSAPPLVDWINASFAQILPRHDDRERGAIAFRPSSAALEDAPPGAANHAPVTLRGFATRAAESAAIAAAIEQRCLLDPGSRIVVLVRARSHARAVAAALRARGIAFRAVDIEPLQDRSIVRDVVALACALLHAGDRTAWLALLRAPWAGLSLADLWRVARAPLVWDALGDESVQSELSADGRARCRRVREALEAAFRVRNDTPLARWVERTWLALGGASCAGSEQELELAAAAFARLAELERRGLPDAAELPGSFADLYADHGDSGAVEIMTIHKAKGLEFDMVVVPALDRYSPPVRGQLLLSHQFARTGRDGLVFAARPRVGAESDRLFDFLRRRQRDAAALEAERLLYVACTRAKDQLLLTAQVRREEGRHGGAPDREPRPWSPHAGSLLAALWPVIGGAFAPDPAECAPPEAQLGAPRGGPLVRVPGDWRPAPALDPFPAEPMLGLPESREHTPPFDWAGETARRVGTLVHAELQRMHLAGDAAPSHAHVETPSAEASIAAREMQFQRWLALHGVPAEHLPQAAARVVEALSAVLGDPRGRWILMARPEDRREYALSSRIAGTGGTPATVVHAVFDRSFIDDGIRWVIDYKTSRHVGGGREEFLDREVERYRPQLQRYAVIAARLGPEPVRLGLYFPLMRAWREWQPETT